MGRYIEGTLSVEPMQGGRTWRLTSPFTYSVDGEESGTKITVPENFVTDFASLPTLTNPIFTLLGLVLFWLGQNLLGFWVLFIVCAFSWLRNWAKFNKAAVIHDWLYHEKKIHGEDITRHRADKIFLDAMLIDFKNYPMGRFIAYLEYCAVYIVAWFAWKTKENDYIYRELEWIEKEKVTPQIRHRDWSAYETMRKRVQKNYILTKKQISHKQSIEEILLQKK